MSGRYLLLVVSLASWAGVASAGEYPVAGVTPNQRPAGAPVIREAVRPAGWDARFFHGVEKPYPASLSWAADQGGWYTPFNRPGSPGPYDIRGWGNGTRKER